MKKSRFTFPVDWSKLAANIRTGVLSLLGISRAIKDVDEWDGAASNYDDTGAYCSACLIDLNPEGEEKKQGLCMLPVRGPGDSADTYVRQAVHAAAGGHGISAVEKPEGVEQAAWDTAVKAAAKKIIAAYEEMDEDAPEGVMTMAGMGGDGDEAGDEEERAIGTWDLRDQIQKLVYDSVIEQVGEAGWAWVTDVYHDNGGEMFAVVAMDGKLHRVPVTYDNDAVTLGDWQEVVMEFRPAGERSRFSIQRTAEGRFRWFGVSCSSVLNRVGEIDSRDLFDSLIANAEETGEYAYRCFYHMKEQFRTGQCDFLARDGNMLVTSGLYDDSDLGRAEVAARTAEPEAWGDSISYYATSAPEMVEVGDGISIPVYRAGILEEITTAPELDVAALYTGGAVLEERTMLKGKALEAFVALWGGDEAKATTWLEENVDEANRTIDDKGQIARTEGQAPAPPVEPPAQPETPPTVELDEGALAEMARSIVNATAFQESLAALIARQLEPLGARIDSATRAIQEMSGRHTKAVKALEDRLAPLEEDEDEKKRAWQADLPAKPAALRVTYRPRTPAEPDAPPDSLASVANETLASMQ
jgi:hypothetical protein